MSNDVDPAAVEVATERDPVVGDDATTVATTDERDDGAGRDGRRRRRRPDRGLLVASAVIAVGLGLIGYGVAVSVTGDERTQLPDEIEAISPVPDAVQVLSQSNVVVDLAEGYTGYLVVDGVRLETVDLGELGSIEVEPGRQVEIPPVTVFEPGNDTLTFTPSEDAPIDEFDSGIHRVQVVYWLVEDGPERPRSYTWTFNVV